MEAIFIYFIKSSCLTAIFFLAYFMLLRKETFFTTNRWFLLAGLVISAVLPLFSIKKVVYVEPTIINQNDVIYSQPTAGITQQIAEQPIETDWFQIGFWVYGIVAIALLAKVIYNCISLYRTLQKKRFHKDERFLLVDVEEDVAPFSFFNYIVYNSNLYSTAELQSIISHEKIHSGQKHSIDVLIATVFSILFWFNPFLYFYKKAIIQNLEFIADHDALQFIHDKKSYQMTLLKVVCPQNYSSITNHFNHSLIKKRIIMLNQNQSHKRNSWKYSVVVPALIAFVILFQVEVIAQEKFFQLEDGTTLSADSRQITDFKWSKNSTDKEFEIDAETVNASGINFDFSNIKRNSKNEIISITVSINDKLGNSLYRTFSNKNGIEPIHFIRDIDFKGKGKFGFFETPVSEPDPIESEPDDLTEPETVAESINEKDMLLIVNGKEYQSSILKNFTLKCSGSIVEIKGKEATDKYGEKAKDGVLIFNGTTTFEENFTTPTEIPAKRTVVFTNDNGDSVVYDSDKNFIKVVGYAPIMLKVNYPVLIINGTEKSNPLTTLQKTDVSKIKSIRVYDANGKETPGAAVAKIVITTK